MIQIKVAHLNLYWVGNEVSAAWERRTERPKQVSPRQRPGDSSQPTFAQNGQKNYYSAHSLCHSAVVGCHSFAPLGGVSLRHPIPRALPGADISLPLRGVGSLTFRRICYPPESNIRIFNPQYPATQPPRKRGVGAHPWPSQREGGKRPLEVRRLVVREY